MYCISHIVFKIDLHYLIIVINDILNDGSEGKGGGRWDDGRVGGYEGDNWIFVFKFMNEHYVVYIIFL